MASRRRDRSARQLLLADALDGPLAHGSSTRKGLRGLLPWTPVAIALVLLAQIGIRGLRPVRAEARRLAAEEVHLGERLDRARERHAAASFADRAHRDEIYLERERRWLQVPDESR